MNNKYTILFLVFICAYTMLFLISPALGPTDDYMTLRTLGRGVPHFLFASDFPYFDPIEMGRFVPLGGIEYNLTLLFSSKPSPFGYYLIHVFQFIILIFLLVKILQNFVIDKKIIYLSIAIFVLTPGFVYSWFRTTPTEKNMVFFLAIFLHLYFSYLKNPKIIYLILAALTANVVIYYKETAFIMMATFSVACLFLDWNNIKKELKLFHSAIILSALIYVVMYSTIVLPQAAVFAYGKNTPFVVNIKNFLNYSFVADPILMFLVVPLAIWRIYRILILREKTQPLYDALLLASFTYIMSYFIIKLWSVYYLQPAYIFAIPPLFYFLAKEYRRLAWKCLGLVAGLLLALNSLPTGMHYLTYFKYMPANFQSTIDFIKNDINTHHKGQRVDIYIAGASCGSTKFLYFIYSEYFLHNDLSANQFDLKSNMANDIKEEGYFPYLGKIPTPYTVFEHCPSPVSRGAYLIIGPNSSEGNTFHTEEYIKSLELDKDYKLVFKTKSNFAFPMISLKNAGRYLLSFGAGEGERFLSISRHRPSLEWPDYYVYVHK